MQPISCRCQAVAFELEGAPLNVELPQCVALAVMRGNTLHLPPGGGIPQH